MHSSARPRVASGQRTRLATDEVSRATVVDAGDLPVARAEGRARERSLMGVPRIGRSDLRADLSRRAVRPAPPAVPRANCLKRSAAGSSPSSALSSLPGLGISLGFKAACCTPDARRGGRRSPGVRALDHPVLASLVSPVTCPSLRHKDPCGSRFYYGAGAGLPARTASGSMRPIFARQR